MQNPKYFFIAAKYKNGIIIKKIESTKFLILNILICSILTKQNRYIRYINANGFKEIDIPKIRRDSLLTSTLLYFSNINELAKKPKEAEIKSGVDLKLKVHTTGLSRKKIIKSDVNDLCILKNLQVFKKPNVKKI